MARIFYNEKMGRIVVREGYATSIHWNTVMLDYLRTNYATMLNEELSDWLGVSPRTMIRKARQLGLSKDADWLRSVWEERRRMAQAEQKRIGYSGGFKKGERANPEGEFKKGHTLTDEQKERQRAGMREWYRTRPREARAKHEKAVRTRMERKIKYQEETTC